MKLQFATLDVFTRTRYAGNPLAIVRVPSNLKSAFTEAQKQAVAIEFNLSETVFLYEPDLSSGPLDPAVPVLYDIFTPRARIAFAGHPTVGTAIYTSHFAADSFPGITTLTTPLVGDVPICYDAAELKASAVVPHDLREHAKRMPHPLPDASTNATGLPDCPIMSIVKGMAFILVPLTDLSALDKASMTGTIVPAADTYKAENLDQGSGWDKGITNTMYYVQMSEMPKAEGEVWELRTRVIGRIEDPGTGSASCALCCWLAINGGVVDGLREVCFRLTQGVEMGRRCEIEVTVTRAENGKAVEKVELRGNAVVVMQGELEVSVDEGNSI